jgi:hypothetical protein
MLQQAVIYINTSCGFAKSFAIEDFPVKPIQISDPRNITEDIVLPSLYQLESFIASLYAENVFDIESHLKQVNIIIDDDWRAKSSSYISHIRNTVSKAGLKTPLHDAIMNRLDELQRQIDVRQVPLETLSNVIFTLTEAVGKGAKNLDPAVKLVERLMGAFYGLRRSQMGEEPKQLPKPENLGLPDYTDPGEPTG